MLASALIVFREVLEAALIIAIVMAATRGVDGRKRWVSFGIAGGSLAAILMAMGVNIIAGSFDGVGQEIVNACILYTAVLMIGWHVIWMNKHGHALSQHMREVGHKIVAQQSPMSVLAVVICLAVMREGAEIVLMLQGLAQKDNASSMMVGALLGLIGGLGLGATIYAGFRAVPLRRLFATTNIFLILIAAGMAAKAANYLAQADILPMMGGPLWDTSQILPEDGMVGHTLGALIGYVARPSGIELLCYAATIAVAATLILAARPRVQNAQT